ncbi:Serine/threonine-protein kinase pkn1 [Vibrio thalassae]|uniref:Serine/threonine-protein kinase pkn1 n=1 Tax=Vibrio thalassae TaxID=1243014 RepID=A0A240EHM5_9VIBR|nr:SUMF1/EgtB/PvdO family nonheme iron enzyme [Vibrio thalassae]SNX47450.1 Serine/threonine-protein kinase pkn1 [Vibrio thalassae]
MKNNIFFILVIFVIFSLVIAISTMSSLNDIPTLNVKNLDNRFNKHYLDVIIDENRSYISNNPNIRKSLRQPEVEVNIKNKYIHQCEVTQKEFNQFVQNSQGRENRSATFSHKISGKLSSPVTGVNFLQAQRYCDSIGGRLPTHYEWEAAATGIERRLYPWGNSFSNDDNPYIDPILNTTKSCGKVISTSTPINVHDLSGNVSEWVVSDQSAMIKGGNGFDKDSIFSSLNLFYRTANPKTKSKQIGFRCIFDNVVQNQDIIKIPDGNYLVGVPKQSLLAIPASYFKSEFNSSLLTASDPKNHSTSLQFSVYEITVDQYHRFLLDPLVHLNLFSSGNQPKNHSYTPLDWKTQLLSPSYPVRGVDWWSAHAFAVWAGGRLPSQDEWTNIYIQTLNHVYHAPDTMSGIQEVSATCSSASTSICGLFDNVSEWTSSVVITPEGAIEMIYKGGNFRIPTEQTLDPHYMQSISPHYRADTLGFRVIFP